MDKKTARYIYNRANDNGDGFPLTEHKDALVVDEIIEAELQIVADHGDGLIECREGDAAEDAHYLVGGDAMGRNAWAIEVPSELLNPGLRVDIYSGARAYYDQIIHGDEDETIGED